jgi:hypothetical protein
LSQTSEAESNLDSTNDSISPRMEVLAAGRTVTYQTGASLASRRLGFALLAPNLNSSL